MYKENYLLDRNLFLWMRDLFNWKEFESVHDMGGGSVSVFDKTSDSSL